MACVVHVCCVIRVVNVMVHVTGMHASLRFIMTGMSFSRVSVLNILAPFMLVMAIMLVGSV